MRIERAGTQRWLVVQEPPEKLWPLVKDFWQESGFLIKIENARSRRDGDRLGGEPRPGCRTASCAACSARSSTQLYSTSERDKFRTRLDAHPTGRAPRSTSAIAAWRRSTPRASRPGARRQTVWQPRAPNPELEAEFLRRLMVRLGAKDERAKQLVASARAAAARATSSRATTAPSGCRCTSLRPRLAPRRPGARPRRLHRRGPRPAEGAVLRALRRSRGRDGRKGRRACSAASHWFSNDSKVKAAQYRVQVTAGRRTAARCPCSTRTAPRALQDRAAHPRAAARAAQVRRCASPRSPAAARATAWWPRPPARCVLLDCGLNLTETERRLAARRPRAFAGARHPGHPRARRPCLRRIRFRRRAPRPCLHHPRHARRAEGRGQGDRRRADRRW